MRLLALAATALTLVHEIMGAAFAQGINSLLPGPAPTHCPRNSYVDLTFYAWPLACIESQYMFDKYFYHSDINTCFGQMAGSIRVSNENSGYRGELQVASL
jgi:hypothetical protein